MATKTLQGDILIKGKLKVGDNADNRVVEITKEAKVNIGSDTKIGPFGKNSTGSTRPIHNESPKGLQVNGSVKVKELQVGLQKYIDEDGNDITWSDGEFKCYGTSRFYNETTIDKSLRVKSKITADEGAYIGGTLDMNRNDIIGVQSIAVSGTSNLSGDVFSDKFKPMSDKNGKLGAPDKRFDYGYIGSIICDNHSEYSDYIRKGVKTIEYSKTDNLYLFDKEVVYTFENPIGKYIELRGGLVEDTYKKATEYKTVTTFEVTGYKVIEDFPTKYAISKIGYVAGYPANLTETNIRDTYVGVTNGVSGEDTLSLIGTWYINLNPDRINDLKNSGYITRDDAFNLECSDNYLNKIYRINYDTDTLELKGYDEGRNTVFTYNHNSKKLEVRKHDGSYVILTNLESYKLTFTKDSKKDLLPLWKFCAIKEDPTLKLKAKNSILLKTGEDSSIDSVVSLPNYNYNKISLDKNEFSVTFDNPPEGTVNYGLFVNKYSLIKYNNKKNEHASYLKYINNILKIGYDDDNGENTTDISSSNIKTNKVVTSNVENSAKNSSINLENYYSNYKSKGKTTILAKGDLNSAKIELLGASADTDEATVSITGKVLVNDSPVITQADLGNASSGGSSTDVLFDGEVYLSGSWVEDNELQNNLNLITNILQNKEYKAFTMCIYIEGDNINSGEGSFISTPLNGSSNTYVHYFTAGGVGEGLHSVRLRADAGNVSIAISKEGTFDVMTTTYTLTNGTWVNSYTTGDDIGFAIYQIVGIK